MEFVHEGDLETLEGGARRFAGMVWQTQIIGDPTSSGMRASRFVYAPGARSAWHSHDHEQTIYVESGEGLVGTWGEPELRTLRAGDWVHVLPGQKHWHGAGPRSTFVHLAINAAGGATWLEHVERPMPRGAGPQVVH